MDEVTEIVVTDMQGAIVSSTGSTTQLSTEHWRQGVYLITIVHTDGSSISKRIIRL